MESIFLSYFITQTSTGSQEISQQSTITLSNALTFKMKPVWHVLNTANIYK